MAARKIFNLLGAEEFETEKARFLNQCLAEGMIHVKVRIEKTLFDCVKWKKKNHQRGQNTRSNHLENFKSGFDWQIALREFHQELSVCGIEGWRGSLISALFFYSWIFASGSGFSTTSKFLWPNIEFQDPPYVLVRTSFRKSKTFPPMLKSTTWTSGLATGKWTKMNFLRWLWSSSQNFGMPAQSRIKKLQYWWRNRWLVKRPISTWKKY